MPRFKRLYILLFPAAATLIAAHSLWMLRRVFHPAWGAVLFGAALVLFYFLNLYRFRTARTSPHLTRMTVIEGFLSLVALVGGFALGAPIPALYGVLLLAGWLLYVFWYSRFGRRPSDRLVVGERLPAFVLESEDGTRIHSDIFHGRPALFIFYRGNWCPFCMAQVREVADAYQQLAARGVAVVLVSPQPHAASRELAARFDAPMHFLVDRDLRAATLLEITDLSALPAGFERAGYAVKSVYPTVVITDATGIIRYVDQTDNYRVRPHPSTFLAIVADLPDLRRATPA